MRLRHKNLQTAIDTVKWEKTSKEDSLNMRFHSLPFITLTSGKLELTPKTIYMGKNIYMGTWDWVSAYRHEETQEGEKIDIWCFSLNILIKPTLCA